MRAALKSFVAVLLGISLGGSAAVNSRATGESFPLSQPSTRIVGGTEAPSYLHKFQVAILFKNISNNKKALWCGGVLVKPNYIVTAAHCSDVYTASEMQVLTGTHSLDGTGVRRNVEKIYVHPNWNRSTLDYDVAVWKLKSSAFGIPLATLASTDAPLGTTLKVTGWGYLNLSGSRPTDLRQVSVPVVSKFDCNDADSYNGIITLRMVCAGLQSGGKDSCGGDSGGPMTRNLGSGFNVLQGIVSFGDECALPEKFGVYTRLTAPSIRNFILNKINP